jgi:hypothetical protein
VIRKFFLFSILSFYLFGTFILPLGDFSVIKDLPSMFRHCKATEDRDLDVFEFLAIHVSGMGQVIEGLLHFTPDEPSDKPHAPVQFTFQQQQIVAIVYQTKVPAVKPVSPVINFLCPTDNNLYTSDYTLSILRPPIA